jgi:hypothetical protein
MVCLAISFLPVFFSCEEKHQAAFHTMRVSASFIVAFAVCIPMIFDVILDVIEEKIIIKKESQSTESVYRFYFARILIILGLIFPPVMFAYATQGLTAFNSSHGIDSSIAAMVCQKILVNTGLLFMLYSIESSVWSSSSLWLYSSLFNASSIIFVFSIICQLS